MPIARSTILAKLDQVTPILSAKEPLTFMSVARVTEITSSSKKSFNDAIESGIERASKTLENISGAWVADQEVIVKNNKIKEYRVKLKVTFILRD